jgi:YegS/Rv2252/BmrU family lipid kinase
MSLTAASEKPRLAGESGPRGGPKAPRVLVIFNPVAGIRRKLKLVHVLDALEEKGCRVITKPTTKRRDAEAFARGLDPATVDVVVAAGGDGTINEVLNGLLGSTIPLGVIPLGTANVLAAEMGLAIDTDGVAQAIANGEPTIIYMGEANGRIFALMVGAGFDAHVVDGVTSKLKRWFGKGAYVWRSLVELFRFPFNGYQVCIAGRKETAASVIISNGRYYGGAFTCTPSDARLFDPSLHVCLFKRKGAINAVRYGLGLVTGRLNRYPDVEVVSAEAVEVHGEDGGPVQGDGDILTALPLSVRLAPKTVRLMMPLGYAARNGLTAREAG